jgi:hypothetical protein
MSGHTGKTGDCDYGTPLAAPQRDARQLGPSIFADSHSFSGQRESVFRICFAEFAELVCIAQP